MLGDAAHEAQLGRLLGMNAPYVTLLEVSRTRIYPLDLPDYRSSECRAGEARLAQARQRLAVVSYG